MMAGSAARTGFFGTRKGRCVASAERTRPVPVPPRDMGAGGGLVTARGAMMEAGEHVRAFLAALTGEDTRQAIARVEQDLKARLGLEGSGRARLTWVRPDAAHLTLKFFRDLDDRMAEPIGEAIAGSVGGVRPIEVPFTRLGVFPRADAPRVLWIGPDESWHTSEAALRLTALRRALQNACATLDVERDRSPWHPHVTLARVRSRERDVALALRSTHALTAPLAVPPILITAIVLMKSELLPDGPRHMPIWVRDLG